MGNHKILHSAGIYKASDIFLFKQNFLSLTLFLQNMTAQKKLSVEELISGIRVTPDETYVAFASRGVNASKRNFNPYPETDSLHNYLRQNFRNYPLKESLLAMEKAKVKETI